MKSFQHLFTGTLLIVCLFLITGCDKYLDITPKGKTLLTTITDYDQWLNDPILDYGIAPPYGLISYMGDNTDVPSIKIPQIDVAEFVYTWAPQFSPDLSAVPVFWSDHYAKINKFNTVLLGIDQATNGTQQQKSSLKAEALLGRALEYFYLVNEYGNSYDSTTAAIDLAVPFVTSNDVTQTIPPRSTVKEIYNQIIGDLKEAISNLPLDNSGNRYRGSVAAGYSLLARVYLYAGDFKDARKNAELALENTSASMMDFNAALPATSDISVQKDVIYGRMVLGYITATLDFMKSFDINDLRVRTLYYSTDNYGFTTRGATIFLPTYVTPGLANINTGTSVQEMKLIIAEAAARSGDVSVALSELDDIRKNRFDAATYVKFQSSDRQTVLEEVLTERAHELPFSGLRWFDMRRLAKEGRMGTVNRYDAQENIIATLTPNSPRYTMQIPNQVLKFNPDMKQNP